MSGTYLPPVVIRVLGDDSEFLKTVTKDQALLKTFEKDETKAVIGADDTPLLDSLAKARVELASFAKQVKDMRLGVDAAPFWADIAKMRAELGAMSPLDINVDANTAAALSKIAALRGALALSSVDQIMPMPVSGGGGGGRSGLLGLLGGLAAGGGGGGGMGGILSALGFGSAGSKGVFGIGAGMASFGSVGSLLGLGAEHLVATLLGVGGSAVGAGVGGGLLGLGALGTSAVGMGTDAAGLGQATNDIKLLVQAQNQAMAAQAQYNYMVKTYGQNSQQAATALQNLQVAQAQVNSTLGSFPTVAQPAILAAANTAQAFEKMFDHLTGPAEKVGAQILQQAMQVGMAFLPTIGKYAAENMGIIKKDIQPLFSWLTSMQGGTGKGFLSTLMGSGKVGGLAIFTNLEQVFQKELPTALNALTQFAEFFAKTIDVAAQQTGQFMSKVSAFFTHMNTPSVFHRWAGEVDKLIGLFRTWVHFMFAVGKTVYDIFKPAVGAGQALIKMLTGALGVLDKWLTTASNAKALHNLFSAHLTELVKGFGAAVGAAIPLVLDFAKGFLPVLTIGAKVGTLVLQPLIWGMHELAQIPFATKVAGWAGSFFLLNKALGGFKLTNITGLMRGLVTGVGGAVRWITLLPTRIGVALIQIRSFGAAMVRGGVQAATWAASQAAAVARALAAWVGYAARWVATTAAASARFLATNAAAMATWVARQATMIATSIAGFVRWAAVSIARVTAAAAVWIAENAAMAAAAAAAFIAENAASLGIVAALAAVVAGVVYLATHWHQVWSNIKAWSLDAWHFLDRVLHNGIVQAVLAPVAPLVVLAMHWRTVWHGMQTVLTDVGHAIEAVINSIVGAVHAAVGAISTLGHAFSALTGKGPSIGGVSLNPLHYLPHLAAGGIVSQPTIALVGEAGPELVLPMSRVNRGGVSALPSSVGASGLGGGANFQTTIQIFAPTGNANDISAQLRRALDQRDQQLMAKLRAGTAY